MRENIAHVNLRGEACQWDEASAGLHSRSGGNDLPDRVFVGVAHDPFHAWQGGKFFGGALRVTTGDQDPACGVLAADATNCGAGVLVRGGGDSAGVQNDNFGLLGRCSAPQSLRKKLLLEIRSVSLRCPAAKVLNEE